MTQEEKQLLLKDLCGRLPYNVVIRCTDSDTDYKCFLTTDILNELLHNTLYYDYKPYLRPLSSMTKDEREYLEELSNFKALPNIVRDKVDFYLEHYLDYRGLIEKGLALEAPEGMYES